MAHSAEFGDSIVQPPLRLATYLEQRISKSNAHIGSLQDYVSSLQKQNDLSELIDALYWLTRETRELTNLKTADSHLSRGKPERALTLLQEEVLDFNHYANECAAKGALESARSILLEINSLRQIKY